MVELYNAFIDIFKKVPALNLIDDADKLLTMLLDVKIESKKINMIETSISICKESIRHTLLNPSKDSYETVVKIISNKTDYAFEAVDEFIRCLLSTGIPNLLFSADLSTLIKCNKDFEGMLVIPDYVKSIKIDAFSHCSKLTSIIFPGSIKELKRDTVSNCDNLRKVVFLDGIERIEDEAFNQCAIEELRFPDSIKVESGSFYLCNSLQRVYIGLSQCEACFPTCGNLEYISVNPNNQYVCSIDGNLYSKDKKTLIRHPPKAGNFKIPDCVVNLGDFCLQDYNGSEIMIPNSVISIGDYAFDYSTNISEIIIPDSVKKIGKGIVRGCSNLKKIAINCDCEDLSYIIEGYDFPDERPKIVHISIGPKNNHLISIDGMVTNKDGSRLLYVPRGLEHCTIPKTVSVIKKNSFAYCCIASVDIGPNVKIIESEAFLNCQNLQEVHISDELKSISNSSFIGCYELDYVLISDSTEIIEDEDYDPLGLILDEETQILRK